VVVAAHKYTCHHCSTIFKGFPVLLLYLQKTPNLISLFLGHAKYVRRSIHNLNSFFGKIAKILWNLRQMLIIVYIFYTDEHFGLMCVIDFEMTWLFALNYGFIFWGLWLFCGQLISVHEYNDMILWTLWFICLAWNLNEVGDINKICGCLVFFGFESINDYLFWIDIVVKIAW